MEAPVTEEGWSSIVSDRRYARKFGRQNGLSPKGRAAIIGAAAAALIAVPILVKTLTHSPKETAQTNPPATEEVQPATETVASTTTATTPATPSTTVPFTPTPTQASAGPAKIAVTEQAAEHEGSTLASVIAKRQPTVEDHSRDNWPPVICPESTIAPYVPHPPPPEIRVSARPPSPRTARPPRNTITIPRSPRRKPSSSSSRRRSRPTATGSTTSSW